MKHKYYILDNNDEPTPCSVEAWGPWFENNKTRRLLAKTKIGPFDISTVFLSLNHNWGDGPPVLWETMVFRNDKGYDDQMQFRYQTSKEALENHAKLVKDFKEDLEMEPEELVINF